MKNNENVLIMFGNAETRQFTCNITHLSHYLGPSDVDLIKLLSFQRYAGWPRKKNVPNFKSIFSWKVIKMQRWNFAYLMVHIFSVNVMIFMLFRGQLSKLFMFQSCHVNFFFFFCSDVYINMQVNGTLSSCTTVSSHDFHWLIVSLMVQGDTFSLTTPMALWMQHQCQKKFPVF